MADHISTLAVHGGEEKSKPYGAVTMPIIQTSTYAFPNTEEVLKFVGMKESGGPLPRDEYGRYSNPTQSVVERKLAALDDGERALLFASGMNAITTTLLALLSSGDHLVMINDCYHRTRDFAMEFLKRWNISVTLVPSGRLDALDQAVRPNTRLIFAESPTNPYLRVVDIDGLVEIARRHRLLTFMDTTFATPVNLRPIKLGVDLVMHSATKYLGGHNDLLAGVVIGSQRILADIEKMRGMLGGMSNPNDAYLLLRGLKTLDLRVRRQNENGLRVAEFLEKHPAIERVHYPGLPSHPDHETARRQMTGFGGVVSFEVKGDFDRTARFIDRIRLPYMGPTLGGVESIIQQVSAFFSLDPVKRKAAGFKDNLVRYALGIEDADDLIKDLDQALLGS